MKQQMNLLVEKEVREKLSVLCDLTKRSRPADMVTLLIEQEYERMTRGKKRCVAVGNNDMVIVDPEWANKGA